MRRNPTWRRRSPAAAFTPNEDAELCQMVRCGLSVDFYSVGLPGRPLGEILDRRLQLIQSGQLRRAPSI